MVHENNWFDEGWWTQLNATEIVHYFGKVSCFWENVSITHKFCGGTPLDQPKQFLTFFQIALVFLPNSNNLFSCHCFFSVRKIFLIWFLSCLYFLQSSASLLEAAFFWACSRSLIISLVFCDIQGTCLVRTWKVLIGAISSKISFNFDFKIFAALSQLKHSEYTPHQDIFLISLMNSTGSKLYMTFS